MAYLLLQSSGRGLDTILGRHVLDGEGLIPALSQSHEFLVLLYFFPLAQYFLDVAWYFLVHHSVRDQFCPRGHIVLGKVPVIYNIAYLIVVAAGRRPGDDVSAIDFQLH
jgi:hypothetical protein